MRMSSSLRCMTSSLEAVLELLAWGLEAHHGHAVLVMYLYVLDAAAYRVQGRVDLDDGVRPVDFDVIQIIAGHQWPTRLPASVSALMMWRAPMRCRMRACSLGHGLGPQVGDAGVQQVAGDDHRSLDAVADGHDGRVGELGGVGFSSMASHASVISALPGVADAADQRASELPGTCPLRAHPDPSGRGWRPRTRRNGPVR